MSDPVAVGWWARVAEAARLRVTSAYGVDVAVAAAVAVPVAAPFVTAWLSGPSPGGPTPLGAVLNAGTVVPLVWRRRAPFTVAVLVAISAILVSLYDRPGQEVQYGALVATYSVADLGRPWQRWGFLGALLVGLPLGSLVVQHNTVNNFMFTLLLPLSAYLVGTLARAGRARAEALEERAARLAREREVHAERAAAEERTRIAHDMHDVLAHAVTLMMVQAEAGPLMVRTHPDRAEHAFDAIAEAGRSAMLQLRRILGVLKQEQEAGERIPPPAVAAIPALVAQIDGMGLQVDFRTEGDSRPLSADAEVAAYRIVQEALTNTMKHAAGGASTVRLAWGRTDLVITVTDDGRIAPEASVDLREGGYGLIGIRERAAAAGGYAEAGPAPGGGFRVTVRLPCLEASLPVPAKAP